jgi:hypothetical protein
MMSEVLIAIFYILFIMVVIFGIIPNCIRLYVQAIFEGYYEAQLKNHYKRLQEEQNHYAKEKQ